jgi:glucokinase
MTIVADGPKCSCGNLGCWEALAAGPAFAAQAQAKGFADGEDAFAAARSGDVAGSAVVAEQARLLGIGIVNLMHLYSPDIVVLGGGVMSGLDLLQPGIDAEIAARAMPPFQGTPVVRARLLDNVGLIGAAALARAHFLGTAIVA